MAEIGMAVEPERVGLDADRLARIDRHLARYVDDGRLPGWSLLLSRHGQIAHLSTYGQRDMEAGAPVEVDTVFRIYSMTKPITSVAAMMLIEEGAFELTDPVSRFIPSFADLRVYRAGSATKPLTVPAAESMRIWHLLTHTSGLTYGFHRTSVVDEMYRQAGFDWGQPPKMDLAAVCDAYAGLPLLFEPGAEWNYSVSTDVLGRLVEVVSGQSLPDFCAQRIFGPLAMGDTAFSVDASDLDRLAALYIPTPGTGLAMRYDQMGKAILRPPLAPSGGGGLASTIGDYHRFTQMLLGCGELEGARILGPRTLRYMASNHLPGNADLQTFGRPLHAETRYDGVGFGLGFSVMLDPVAYKCLGSPGQFGWGGAASTAFWVDPAEELTMIFMTQLLPSSSYPIRTELANLTYQALVD